MPESSIVVRPEPEGTPPSTRLQAAGLLSAIKLFEEAARTVPLPSAPQPIVIADYGAGTGHNSLQPIGAAITTLRGRTRPEHSVLVTHTDTVDNDFSALFRTVAEDSESYLRKDSATFTSAVGRSFYTQILPSNSVNLGWSAWSLLWLGRVPMPVPDHIAVACSADAHVRDSYARQAAHDWHEFVAFRGRELCPGGRLVVLTMALAEDGDFGYGPLLAALTDTLFELRTDGFLNDDEVQRMSLPIVGRRAADFVAPFAPSGRFERLTIEHLDVFDADDRFFNQYRTEHDAKVFGAQWASFCRFAVFGVLAEALDGGSADPRRTTFFDRLEAGVAARLSAAPEPTRIPLAQVVLEKRRRG
ncbi:SAM-dependent methyltransferase [Mycolicibacterium mageritense]|uniref:SAM-dependent methyltransferase n=1 Tax=Mycolicibacterium mageritense TaxID=53462 RepID=UPI0011D3CC5A|nr:SAM-dependent methyltransferase [Mycolicibacterium mageritense]TXI54258.1 MAG: SAM-dependent methyltransferase [Mycolicibacterium mageritense]